MTSIYVTVKLEDNTEKSCLLRKRDVQNILTRGYKKFESYNFSSGKFNFYCHTEQYGEVSVRRIMEYFLDHHSVDSVPPAGRTMKYSNSYSAVNILNELGIIVFAHDEKMSANRNRRFQRSKGKGLLLFDNLFQEKVEVNKSKGYAEGKRREKHSVEFERSVTARSMAIQVHGLTCKACEFNFYETYGDLGVGFIEVHHIEPLAYRDVRTETVPHKDLTVLCSNCHRMIHIGGGCMPVEELRRIINLNQKSLVLS